MNILYIVGGGSKNKNQELRWSLRALEKYATCPVQPMIVGTAPDWFNGPVLEHPDCFNRKAKNIFDKILFAIDHDFIGGEFMISADDHFLTQPTDYDNSPRYWRNSICAQYRGGNNYAKAMAATRDTLLNSGYPAMDFTVHYNGFVNAADAAQARQLIESSTRHRFGEFGILAWAVFGNLAMISGKKRPVLFRNDIKIGEVSEEELAAIVKDNNCFSINDYAFCSDAFLKYMAKEFGRKCRWEK